VPPELGSSPLARGLLVGDTTHVPVGRIIPARAGFTHEEVQNGADAEGSSPLARGLLRA